ncbi:HD domain-containing phosphohydrolase [Polynucleobacter sp. AP-Reno-20A-A9]|uniref:HD domain-containing phosphohydrolase n=1 Tax=Polynucleobacter sp. AP-Reno-20A-A9 TaxID=2576925 RepID=UPI001C0C056A|nr:HD domain-containing phosphohydrolase [Polynucleobacter sp. AP-Reno-20A-A9]MBU3629102.1 HD domain-containing protein [Polynucleobacter sp. AP-Reno-20A-A9]
MTIDSNSFQQAFEEMEDPAFFHDSQFRLMLANAAYYRKAGISESEGLGRPYWEVFPKGDGPLTDCNASIVDGKHASNADEFFVDGRGYISRGYAIRNNLGEPVYSLHIISDITDKLASEKKLAKIASQFKVLFDSSPDAIMLLDEKGYFDCNPAALSIFGCKDRSDFIGRHPSEFSPPLQPNGIDSITSAGDRIAEAFRNGSAIFEWTHSKLDGTPFPAEVLLVVFEREGKQVLQATVRDITARKNYEQNLANEAVKLNKALAGTVTTMSKAMELRDPYTAGHQARVAEIACAIAKELGWDDYRITGLRMAGLVHDIGKIGIPSEILTKPSSLSEFEEKLVQLHPEHGYGLLKDIEFPWAIADMVRQHHERMDGSGYPLGLKGEDILPEARVLAVADMLEALSTHRPYRAARGLPFALDLIKSESGKQLDSEVVAAAVRLFEGKESLIVENADT